MYINRKRGSKGVIHCVGICKGIGKDLELSKVQECSFYCLCLVLDSECETTLEPGLGIRVLNEIYSLCA